MTVVLTQEVEGLNVGDNYTGPNEAYLLASGYASQAAYTGPGVANTGAADTTIANNREFDATRGNIAHGSDLPFGATNDGVKLGPADPPRTTTTDPSAPVSEDTTGVFDGFANDPDAAISTVLRATGAAASDLPAAGGTALQVKGYGFKDATAVQFGGTAGTAFSVVDDRTINVTSPAKAAGSYTVTVVRPEGNLTKANAVTYV
jgi:hypothetical protein